MGPQRSMPDTQHTAHRAARAASGISTYVWTEDDALGRADLVLARLAAAGVTVQADNRIAQAARTIRDAKHQGSSLSTGDAARFHVLTEAHRTILETYAISCALDVDAAGMVDKLGWLLKGSGDPRYDSNPTARNTQFELVVAAVLRLAGIPLIRIAEPDIQIDGPGGSFGLAVKRVTSKRKKTWQTRVTEASRQLRRQGLNGFLAFNLDNHLQDLPADGDKRATNDALVAAVTTLVGMIPLATEGPHILAVIGFGTAIGWRFRPGEDASVGVRCLCNIHWIAPVELRRYIERFSYELGRKIQSALADLLAPVADEPAVWFVPR